MFASRFTNLDEARALFGDRVDRLGPFLMRADPLADAVADTIAEMPPGDGRLLFQRMIERGGESAPEAPVALRSFFAAVERVPVWVDWSVVDDGGRVLIRAGPLGGLVLGLKSLVTSYTSPAGNKPLVLSGRMQEDAPRRLNETARFVRATILPGGMRPRAPGWRSTLEVRLIHAQVRRLILASGRWDSAAWGLPINQHDQAGTSLLFSLTVIDGLRQLGVRISPDESEDYLHLWRWSGWLMGIDPELLAATEREARQLADLMSATQAPPDDDSRALTRALLDSPRTAAKTDRDRRIADRSLHFSAAVCRLLVGDSIADQLAVARSPLSYAAPIVRRLLSTADRVRQSVPSAQASARRAGRRYWDRLAEVGMANATSEFVLPERLRADVPRRSRE